MLSGAMTAVLGLWLAVAALLLAARALGALRARRALALAAITLLVTAGTAAMRADTIERFAEFLGIRDRVEQTGVESYAHRTLLAYIGGRIWLDRPITGVGWQASSEEWAYGPFLDDARERFPNEPDQAFPSPEHPWGIQLLYLQVAADLGIAGIALLLGLAAAAVTAGVRGLRSSPAALVGLGWLCVAAGVWAGIGLVAGLPLGALTWIAIGLATVRDPRSCAVTRPGAASTRRSRCRRMPCARPLVRWLASRGGPGRRRPRPLPAARRRLRRDAVPPALRAAREGDRRAGQRRQPAR